MSDFTKRTYKNKSKSLNAIAEINLINFRSVKNGISNIWTISYGKHLERNEASPQCL